MGEMAEEDVMNSYLYDEPDDEEYQECSVCGEDLSACGCDHVIFGDG